MEGDAAAHPNGHTARGKRGRERILTAAVEFFAREGVGDISLRGIANAIGTSHRMIIYHFGSREGLLAAVVERFSSGGHDALRAVLDDDDVRQAASGIWSDVVDSGQGLGPLFFELSSQAMRGRPESALLGRPVVQEWVEALRVYWERMGTDPRLAPTVARIDYAVSIGLLHDLLLTGDRAEIDAALRLFNDTLHSAFDGTSGGDIAAPYDDGGDDES